MKSKIITIILTSVTLVLHSQNLQWVNNIGASSSFDGANCVTTNLYNEICVSGYFTGTTDLNPNGTPVTLVSYGSADAFLTKYSETGTLLWGKHFGGTGADYIFDVKTDSLTNIYIVGYFDSPTFDADPSPLTYNLVGNSYEGFIVKLDANANLIWAKTIGGAGSDGAFCLDIDAAGNLIIGGFFNGMVDFDPGVGTANLTASVGQNGFILRLDPNGNFVSVAQQGDAIQQIKSNSNGDINLIGYFSGTKDIDPGAGISNTTAQGSINSYACKLNNTNDLLWKSALLGAGQIWPKDLAIETNGDVIVVGSFNNNIQMNPAYPDTIDYTIGYEDAFIIRLKQTDGSFLWGKQIGGVDDDEPRSVTIDENGYIYYTATFWYTIDADPGIGIHNLTSTGYIDYYLSRLNGNGDFIWANSFGNLNADYAQDILYSGTHGLLVCGQYQNTIDFDPATGTDTINAGLYNNGFLAKYNSCNFYQTNVIDTGCVYYPYLGSNGWVTLLTSGIYVDTMFSSITQCDSFITLNLTIINFDSTVVQTGGTLTAVQNGATYQWGDCVTELPIPGETNQSFTPTINGEYGCNITINGCTEFSGCFIIDDVGLEDNSPILINIFPNPTHSYLNIISQKTFNQIKIYDLSGKSVFANTNCNKNQLQIDATEFATGLYLIEISNGTTIIHQKFIKE